MPRFKKIPSLYSKCICILYNIIFDYCSRLKVDEITDDYLQLRLLHEYLVANYPTSVLDDLLQFHALLGVLHNDSLKSFFFYNVVAHKNIKRFEAKNYSLNRSLWRVLFQSSFSNLVALNLALSCNDEILELIPEYCPHLEILNATCKYERLDIGVNACTFALPVTDFGLRFLCQCKKLRKITLNEPRSNNRGFQNSITYEGLRGLLKNIQTLEDISYSDIGKVVCQGLENLQSLNLKIIRHFNATPESMKEILRLCSTNLKELYLTFFNSDPHISVWQEIMNSNLQLYALEVMNLNCKTMFSDLFRSIGDSLIYLSIANNFLPLTFSNLVTIGRFCPNLRFLNCSELINRNERIVRPKNFGQFSKLESLHISGDTIDVENVLIFCTENADSLENLRFMERSTSTANVDRIFIEKLNPVKLRYIEVSIKLPFSALGIRMLIMKYPLLKYLNVSCADDCRDLIQEIKEMNYDLVFVNKMYVAFQQI